ncbi:SHOCT domain-containing protein [Myxococcus sp. K38C18041901]|uniref:SHOCT domain-containing protein n=1 Tax=Myxococcus guangdongensis TaxID=2906760 RepID=UPI0020A7AAA9|nr:SHOCT domain-containing protein [Myxococcus guangdongensis]MCP3064000.1 SHOCT domain-containing protein [Myxococcus guangdongensis]
MPELTPQNLLILLVILSVAAQLFYRVIAKGEGPLGYLVMKSRVLANGEVAEATILEQSNTAIRLQKKPLYKLHLRVHRKGHPPYEAHAWTTVAHRLTTGWVAQGNKVQVKLDPNHPEKVFVVGPLQTPATALPSADPVKAMEDLRRMVDAGHITPDEYEAKRTEILSRM